MIISIKGIDFDVEYTYHGGCRQTDVDPGENAWIEFESISIDGVEVFEIIAPEWIESIEEQLIKELEREEHDYY